MERQKVRKTWLSEQQALNKTIMEQTSSMLMVLSWLQLFVKKKKKKVDKLQKIPLVCTSLSK